MAPRKVARKTTQPVKTSPKTATKARAGRPKKAAKVNGPSDSQIAQNGSASQVGEASEVERMDDAVEDQPQEQEAVEEKEVKKRAVRAVNESGTAPSRRAARSQKATAATSSATTTTANKSNAVSTNDVTAASPNDDGDAGTTTAKQEPETKKVGRGRKRKVEPVAETVEEVPPTKSERVGNSVIRKAATAATAAKDAQKAPVRRGRKKFRLFIESFLPKELGDRVLSCGEGEQLGHPGRTTTKKPRAIDTLPVDKKIVQVVAGGVHSLVLLEDGTVYSCGINEKGTVPAEGVEAEGSTDRLTRIDFSDEIRRLGKLIMLTAGASFSAGLTDKGSVIAWGNIRDSSGCIESHALLREMEIHPVVIVRNRYRVIVKIAAGENHLVMLSESGELLTFGDGSMGQLGRMGRCAHIRAQQMVDESGDLLKVSVLDKGKHQLVLFDDIMAGGYWTAAKSHADGRIFVCGLNNFGHLGIEPPKVEQDAEAKPGDSGPELRIMRPVVSPAYRDRNIVQLCGVQHVIALDEKGNLYGIGKNTDNALGLGTWTGNDDTEHWRYTHLEKIDLPGKADGIAAKLGCSVAWTQEGIGYSWGCDTSGQLGLGIKDDDDDKVIPKPKQITSAHLDGYRIIGASMADNHAMFLAAKVK